MCKDQYDFDHLLGCFKSVMFVQDLDRKVSIYFVMIEGDLLVTSAKVD